MTPRRQEWPALVSLAVIALQTGAVGIWAGLMPASFMADFPGAGLRWIVGGHYDEHFVRDVGFLQLALCVIAVRLMLEQIRAGWSPQLRTFGMGWTAFAIPHLVFHLTHTAGLEALAVTTSLAALVLSGLAGLVLLVPAGRCR
jgi:hypothetical protein